jgi:hypothetical protein
MEIMGTLLWLACAVACYYIAATKNRNAVGWGIGGLFFGIFALLVIIFIKPIDT